jgi:hypothetical protein
VADSLHAVDVNSRIDVVSVKKTDLLMNGLVAVMLRDANV